MNNNNNSIRKLLGLCAAFILWGALVAVTTYKALDVIYNLGVLSCKLDNLDKQLDNLDKQLRNDKVSAFEHEVPTRSMLLATHKKPETQSTKWRVRAYPA